MSPKDVSLPRPAAIDGPAVPEVGRESRDTDAFQLEKERLSRKTECVEVCRFNTWKNVSEGLVGRAGNFEEKNPNRRSKQKGGKQNAGAEMSRTIFTAEQVTRDGTALYKAENERYGSGREDLNLRPPAPEAGALPLRYAPSSIRWASGSLGHRAR